MPLSLDVSGTDAIVPPPVAVTPRNAKESPAATVSV